MPREVKETPAGGFRGKLIRDGDKYVFRVYERDEKGHTISTDHILVHPDLNVIIPQDEDASFFQVGDNSYLDISSEGMKATHYFDPKTGQLMEFDYLPEKNDPS